MPFLLEYLSLPRKHGEKLEISFEYYWSASFVQVFFPPVLITFALMDI